MVAKAAGASHLDLLVALLGRRGRRGRRRALLLLELLGDRLLLGLVERGLEGVALVLGRARERLVAREVALAGLAGLVGVDRQGREGRGGRSRLGDDLLRLGGVGRAVEAGLVERAHYQ